MKKQKLNHIFRKNCTTYYTVDHFWISFEPWLCQTKTQSLFKEDDSVDTKEKVIKNSSEKGKEITQLQKKQIQYRFINTTFFF